MVKEALEDYGNSVLITHFGDLVKHICTKFFDWDGKKDEYGRHLLQYVGTDIVRKQNPDYWVNFIIGILRFFEDNWDYVVIPDARFPNEINRLVDSGFKVTHMRVVRSNYQSTLTEEQQSHPSETALDDVIPDILIMNNGTLEDLESSVRHYIKENSYA